MAIELRKFKPNSAVQWFKAGWQIFKTQPLTFVMMHLFIIVVGLIAFMMPVLNVAASLLTPFLMAGFYQAVVAKQLGQKIVLADVLKPLSNKGHRLGLFRLGLYQVGAGLLLALLSSSLFTESITMLSEKDMSNPAHVSAFIESLNMGSIVLFFTAFSVYLMAFAYAVPLVYFKQNTKLFEVFKASLAVFYHNIGAMTVFGLISAVLIVASAPLSLIPLLVFVPICYISFFVSFQAIFMPVIESAAPQSNTPDEQSQSRDDNSSFDA